MRRYVLLIIVIIIAIVRVILNQISPQDGEQMYGDGKLPATIQGTIVEDPDYRDRNVKLILQPETVIKHGKIILNAPRNGNYALGDRIEVQGILTRPISFKSKNGSVFDYAGYLGKDDIFYEMKSPKYIKFIGGDKTSLASYLAHIKYIFADSIHQALREPHASFALGILIGGKGALGKELLDAFRSTGLVHMIVLSGYNVSLIVSFAIILIPNFGKLLKLSIGIIAIMLFAIFVGGGATVIRASVMAGCGLGAEFFGIKYNPLKALLLAGALMVIYNPKIFLSDPSFHLSFLATLSIILFSGPMDWLFAKFPRFISKDSWLGPLISTTISAQILTAPYIAYSMHALPMLGIVANVLVTPITPVLMLAVFVLGVLSMVIGPGSVLITILGIANYSAIQYIFWVVNLIAGLPYSSVSFNTYTKTQVFITYALILIVYVCFVVRLRRRSVSLIQPLQNGSGPFAS